MLLRSKTGLLLLLMGTMGSCDVGKSLNKSLLKTLPAIDTISRNAGRNVAGGIGDSATAITRHLIKGLKGAVDTLDPDIRKIFRTIDSLGTLSSDQLTKLGNTLDSQFNRIQGKVDTKKIQQFLVSTLEKLTGTLNTKTKNLLNNAIQTALDSLQTKRSKQKISGVIAALLNETTKARLQSIVTAAVAPTIDSISAHIDASIHKNVPFIQKKASELLWTLGLIAVGIISVVWYQRVRYKRLLEILTYHIDKIPDQNMYDHLTKNIKEQTQTEKLELLLRKTLHKVGINPQG